MSTEAQPEKLVRRDEVLARIGLSDSSLKKQVAAGTFPRPVQIGPRAVAWKSSEVDAWIANLPSKVAA